MDPNPLLDTLALGFAHCHAVAVDHGELLVSLFMAGLVGSIGHCVGMCGPFVLGQTVARLEATSATEMREWHRLAGAALVPYHLGRLTTYTALGAAAAAVAGEVIDLTGLKWLSAILLAAAALLFIGYALERLGVSLSRRSNRSSAATGWLSRQIAARARPLFARPVGWRGYALGIALGFIPCGLLYGALAAAAASGSALSGAFGMAAFALGTVPTLIAIGWAGHVAGQQWRGVVARVTPVLFLINAAALSWLAWSMVA